MVINSLVLIIMLNLTVARVSWARINVLYFLQDQLQVAEELKAKEEQLLRGNPLLNNPTATFSVKRRLVAGRFQSRLNLYAIFFLSNWTNSLYHWLRWDDDVVFKNQARGETKTPKRFINDTIRNDFHRKFLQKYMK